MLAIISEYSTSPFNQKIRPNVRERAPQENVSLCLMEDRAQSMESTEARAESANSHFSRAPLFGFHTTSIALVEVGLPRRRAEALDQGDEAAAALPDTAFK